MPPESEDDNKNSTAAYVSDPLALISLSQFPEDIIIYILKFLPVKSILRFKCVSKQWLSLLSSPNFISMHRKETSSNQLNHSFIVRNLGKHRFQQHHYHEMSLLNINSNDKKPMSLFNPFPWIFEKIDLVGSINGLVCISSPQFPGILLWNPAMNLYKAIRFCAPAGQTPLTTLSFSYDSVDGDYNVIRIDFRKRSSPMEYFISRAEVYSANLDSWKSVQIDSHLVVPVTKSIVVAKGIPCGTGILYQANNHCKFTKNLMYYDMRNGSFKHVPPPELAGLEITARRYVEWKGNLGMIVCTSSMEREDVLDILVYDEILMCWNKISSHGPIGFKMERPIQCSKDGVILLETKNGKLILYDPVTNGIKEFSIPGALPLSFQAYGYTESLVALKGMEQVKEAHIMLIKMMLKEIGI